MSSMTAVLQSFLLVTLAMFTLAGEKVRIVYILLKEIGRAHV